MGGILPAFRGKGLAARLAEYQESWALQQGFDRIMFKTRNKHRHMLRFAISRGFSIIGFEPREETGEHRILLEKMLK